MGFFKLQRGVNSLQLEAGDCWYAIPTWQDEQDVRAGVKVSITQSLLHQHSSTGQEGLTVSKPCVCCVSIPCLHIVECAVVPTLLYAGGQHVGHFPARGSCADQAGGAIRTQKFAVSVQQGLISRPCTTVCRVTAIHTTSEPSRPRGVFGRLREAAAAGRRRNGWLRRPAVFPTQPHVRGRVHGSGCQRCMPCRQFSAMSAFAQSLIAHHLLTQSQ
jgi:hypothetical protein